MYQKQSRIDKPQCPLGHGDMVLKKTWKAKNTTIELWECPRCKQRVRIPYKTGGTE